MTVDIYARAKALTAEPQWQRVDYEGTLNGHEATLVRQCKAIDDEQQQLCLDYLNGIYSYNTARAGKKTYPGVWRVVSNKGGIIKPVDGKNFNARPISLRLSWVRRKSFLG